MKKHSKSAQRSEPSLKRTKARGPVQRDAKEVLAEVLGKLTGKLNAPAELTRAKEDRRGNTVGPNRDRLTVGVDLGDCRANDKAAAVYDCWKIPTCTTILQDDRSIHTIPH